MKNIKLNYLKVKIQNLADEAKYIRKNEIKAARKLELLKLRNKLADKNLLTNSQMNRIVKKFEHYGIFGFKLVGINKQDPAWLDYQHQLKVELKEHRKTIVRDEARAAQLAYAFLRDKKYADIEKPIVGNIYPAGINDIRFWNHGDKIWDRVESIAYGFSERNTKLEDWITFKEKFDPWKEEALKYLRGRS